MFRIASGTWRETLKGSRPGQIIIFNYSTVRVCNFFWKRPTKNGWKNEKTKRGGGKLFREYSVSRLCCVRSRKFAGRAAVFSSVWAMKEKPIKSPPLMLSAFSWLFFRLSFSLSSRDTRQEKKKEKKRNGILMDGRLKRGSRFAKRRTESERKLAGRFRISGKSLPPFPYVLC